MIHKEGFASIFIAIGLSIGAFFLVRALFPYSPWIYYTVLFLGILFCSFILQFFRNPERNVVFEKRGVVSPADGTILVLEKTTENEFLNQEMTQISIFMSPFNIHKNLNPINGHIDQIVYHPGKFLVAYNPKSSIENERCSYLYRTEENEKIVMRQIAGAVARRIVCYLTSGRAVNAGDEMGFIKFGSRVDLFIPDSYEILVKLNEKVKAGESLIAKLKRDEFA